VIEKIRGRDVLDDIPLALVRSHEVDPCGAVERNEGAIASDGHVERGRVVPDEERTPLDDREQISNARGADPINHTIRDASREFPERGTLIALAGSTNENDRVHPSVEHMRDERGESLGRPTLARPAARWGHHGESPPDEFRIGLDAGASVGGGTEAHVRDGINPCPAQQLEHSIDGVKRGRDGVTFVEPKPPQFTCVREPDASRCSRTPREEPGSSEPLEIDHEIIACAPERAHKPEGASEFGSRETRPE
jgi:hypothetical protein